MKGSALGFSFITLVVVLAAVVAHLVIIVGIVTGEASVMAFITYTPIFGVIIVVNLRIVLGLKREQMWAVYLGAVEALAFALYGVIQYAASDWTGLPLMAYLVILAGALLSSLHRDRTNFKPQARMYV